MAIASLRKVDIGYGGAALIESAELNIEAGERIAMLGRNGSGKSTLLKILCSQMEPLSGVAEFQKGLKTAILGQEVPAANDSDVFDVVSSALGQQGRMLSEYFELSTKIAEGEDAKTAEKLSLLSAKIEAAGAWQINQKIETVLSKMGLDGAAAFGSLSAGLKRRVMLAKALVDQPDLLLLDEPTNHLDVDSIRWLEDYLIGSGITLVFVTHDREFLRRLGTRIIEIDFGRLFSFDCGYDDYLIRKQQMLEARIAQQEQFNKKLAAEEVWIRKGIQGRRTRNEGRVRALKAMRDERQNRRQALGTAKMNLQEAQRSGNLVAQAKDITFGYDEQAPIVKDFSATIMRGDRVGILGKNGIGKTTLLNLLLGEIKPQSGSIRLGVNIEAAYFDQLHNQLDENKTVVDNVADGYKTIQMDGKPRNVIGYLNDFLFLPERSKSLVSSLSGGERSRLLLARLFAKPSNLLVLDEPTNNLDIETLELLEELLQDYSGTVLIVSHDRAFINNTVTSTFVFEGDGFVKEYAGGYDDYIRQSKAAEQVQKQSQPKAAQKPKPREKNRRKLSYSQKKELQELPGKIEQLEEEIARLHKNVSSADFYRQSSEQIAACGTRLQELEKNLEQSYNTWQQLEALDG